MKDEWKPSRVGIQIARELDANLRHDMTEEAVAAVVDACLAEERQVAWKVYSSLLILVKARGLGEEDFQRAKELVGLADYERVNSK